VSYTHISILLFTSVHTVHTPHTGRLRCKARQGKVMHLLALQFLIYLISQQPQLIPLHLPTKTEMYICRQDRDNTSLNTRQGKRKTRQDKARKAAEPLHTHTYIHTYIHTYMVALEGKVYGHGERCGTSTLQGVLASCPVWRSSALPTRPLSTPPTLALGLTAPSVSEERQTQHIHLLALRSALVGMAKSPKQPLRTL